MICATFLFDGHLFQGVVLHLLNIDVVDERGIFDNLVDCALPFVVFASDLITHVLFQVV